MELLIFDFQNTKAAEAVGAFGDNWLLQFRGWVKVNFPTITKIHCRTTRDASGKLFSLQELGEVKAAITHADILFVCDSKSQRDILRYCAGKKVLLLPSPFSFGASGGVEFLRVKNKIVEFLGTFEKGASLDYSKENKTFGL